MDVFGAIKAASEESGLAFTGISGAIGKSRQYVHTMAWRESVPSVELFGMMLAACGLKLCAVMEVPKGAILIDSFQDGKTFEERLAEVAEAESE